jgi:thiamine biosynthesis lipoprotein
VPVRTELAMGTLVTMRVLSAEAEALAALDRAFAWFREIEAVCTRFDEGSELRRATERVGAALAVSPILFETVRFALLVAERTGGAFDPAVGRRMEARGLNREYRSGATVDSGGDGDASYRDVELDEEQRTLRVHRPLTLDLGAAAKGLAVDAAARELTPYRNFAIDAGGDLYLGGCNDRGAPWCVGIRHPRREGELITSIELSDQAVCTSGDYERGLAGGEHHILDPRTGTSPWRVASATVVAPNAMLADALATAAFVLGPEKGIELFHEEGVEGLILTPELEEFRTRAFRHAA